MLVIASQRCDQADGQQEDTASPYPAVVLSPLRCRRRRPPRLGPAADRTSGLAARDTITNDFILTKASRVRGLGARYTTFAREVAPGCTGHTIRGRRAAAPGSPGA